jgi:hypothetical protein
MKVDDTKAKLSPSHKKLVIRKHIPESVPGSESEKDVDDDEESGNNDEKAIKS